MHAAAAGMLSVKSPRGGAAVFKQLPQEENNDTNESQLLKLLALFAAALTQSSNDRYALNKILCMSMLTAVLACYIRM